MGLENTEKDMGITEKLRELIPNGYGYNSEFAHTMEDAAVEIERLRQGADVLREELQKARHDLMVRETAAEERASDVEAAGHRLALELECLLLDCKDMAIVSKWFDSGMEALAAWRALDQQPHISPLGMD